MQQNNTLLITFKVLMCQQNSVVLLARTSVKSDDNVFCLMNFMIHL